MTCTPKTFPIQAYRLLVKCGSYLQSPALLILRLAWGWELYTAGSGHLHDVAGTAANFKEWGVPLPTLSVYVAGSTEMIGGVLLMLGLFTRGIALPLIFNFLVAYLTASRTKVIHAFTGPDRLDWLTKIIDDAAFPFLVTAIVMLAFGPGKISLDYLLGRFVFGRCKCAAPSDPVSGAGNPQEPPAT
jgi:putative oxidoreductase